MLKKILCLLTAFGLIFSSIAISVYASDIEENLNNATNSEADASIPLASDLSVEAKSAILMDAETGTVLYSKDAHTALPPASVTKIMTLLLVAEAIDEGRLSPEDRVFISANASSMGGSQIFLKEGEEFSIEELLKSTVIASANDAAVALAERLCGNEQSFVALMNRRASELGMKHTHFENATGLDDSVTNHLTSAYDIALMSRELIKHGCVMKYSNVWQDSIRGGEFILTNTNRLVRYYAGCTGLKTGSTDKAGFCVSATAARDGMHLIAVVMGAETRDKRNETARTMLDYGFANYAVYTDAAEDLEQIPVKKGKITSVTARSDEFKLLVSKSDLNKIEKRYDIPASLLAPFSAGDKIGAIIYTLDGNELGRATIRAAEECEELDMLDVLWRIIMSILVG